MRINLPVAGDCGFLLVRAQSSVSGQHGDKVMINNAPSLPDRVECISPDLLTENPNPPKPNNRRKRRALSAFMNRVGQLVPIVIDENNRILAGNARVEAVRSLGWTEIAAVRVTHLTQAEKDAFEIADNKLPELGEWNKAVLKEMFEQIIILDPSLEIELTGFTTAEVDIILDTPSIRLDGSNADDDIIQPNPQVVARSGDVFIMGKHRLICGSALDLAVYTALLKGETVTMIVTDPPYNVQIAGIAIGQGRHHEFVEASGEMTREQFIKFLRTMLENASSHIKDGGILFVFMDWRHVLELQTACESAGLALKNICCWVKSNAGMGSFYRSKHELVFVLKSGIAPHINNFGLGETGRYRTNVWEYAGQNSFGENRNEDLTDHPTVKPTAMFADTMRDCSKRGDIILDPFCGSGTTLLAAERTGRQARCIELDPIYIDVAIRRWMDRIGTPVTHEETGLTFEELALERTMERTQAAPRIRKRTWDRPVKEAANV